MTEKHVASFYVYHLVQFSRLSQCFMWPVEQMSVAFVPLSSDSHKELQCVHSSP